MFLYFKKWVKIVQTAGYYGASTVFEIKYLHSYLLLDQKYVPEINDFMVTTYFLKIWI